jgi:hypothetical protein
MLPGVDPRRTGAISNRLLVGVLLGGVLVAVVVSALLVTIGERIAETRHPYQLLVQVDEDHRSGGLGGQLALTVRELPAHHRLGAHPVRGK